jgi:hypothetical protein
MANHVLQNIGDPGQLGDDPCQVLLELRRRDSLGRTFQIRTQLAQGCRIDIGTRAGELVYRARELIPIAASEELLNLCQQRAAADEVAFHQVGCEVSVSASHFIQGRQVDGRGTGGGELWQNFLQPLRLERSITMLAPMLRLEHGSVHTCGGPLKLV